MDAWTDDEIERIAESDPDHPALDDAFWQRGDEQLSAHRSLQEIEQGDLRYLARRAIGWLDGLALQGPDRPSGRNRPNLRLIALAQGAAQHFVDGRNGIKDFDLWAFFDAGSEPSFPHRPVWSLDYGPSRFGVNPDDAARGYRGRRIDLMGRSIPFRSDRTAMASVRDWLKAEPTRSAHLIAQRPVVGIYPETAFGQIIWPYLRARAA